MYEFMGVPSINPASGNEHASESYYRLYEPKTFDVLPVNEQDIDGKTLRWYTWYVLNKRKIVMVFKVYLLWLRTNAKTDRYSSYYHEANAIAERAFPEYGWYQIWCLLEMRVGRASNRLNLEV